jgi:threonylcarbamoyladenosine tRNA methylthiotransferase MtaB
MPHFHLSAQSGDDLILKRMKRRHARADVIAFVNRVRALRPDAVFGADLIAGFPTETEAMFANSCALVDDCGLTHLHVFPYSVRPGTPAARMPQVPGAEIKARAAKLRELGRAALTRYLASRVGGACEVLVEKADATGASGHDAHFVPVRLSTPAPWRVSVGDLVRARVTAATDTGLTAGALPA